MPINKSNHIFEMLQNVGDIACKQYPFGSRGKGGLPVSGANGGGGEGSRDSSLHLKEV